jgi:hypothetical protein
LLKEDHSFSYDKLFELDYHNFNSTDRSEEQEKYFITKQEFRTAFAARHKNHICLDSINRSGNQEEIDEFYNSLINYIVATLEGIKYYYGNTK